MAREVAIETQFEVLVRRTLNKTYARSRIRENSERFLSSHELSYGFVKASRGLDSK